MPDIIKSGHHTIADWDFEHGGDYRSLANDFFISPPTSLKYVGAPAGWWTSVLCRIPDTLCLPEGEMRTWYRKYAGGHFFIQFRNQSLLGTSELVNCYSLYFSTPNVYLRAFIGGGLHWIDNIPAYQADNEWMHWRVFWYNGFTPAEAPALCVDLYREIAGEWVREGATLYDTNNRWKDEPVNRCGLIPYPQFTWKMWYDDTEIWGPV